MRAAIVLGDDFDIFVTVAAIQFILDAEVGEMDAIIEVRQVMVVRPALNLPRVAIRAAVGV